MLETGGRDDNGVDPSPCRFSDANETAFVIFAQADRELFSFNFERHCSNRALIWF